jgi:hypothetical protein
MKPQTVIQTIPVHIHPDRDPAFVVKVTEKDDAFVTGVVEEADTWAADGTVVDTSPYLAFMIKWDGCSHLDFGRVDEHGHRDGYVHLCGGEGWTAHLKLMKWLFEWAEKEIPMDSIFAGKIEF